MAVATWLGRFLDSMFVNRMIFLIRAKRYLRVEQSVRHRLEADPLNYGALYASALLAYYRGDSEEAYHSFRKLVESHKTDPKSERWFGDKVFSQTLYIQKDYEIVAKRCKQLLPFMRSKSAKIAVLKHLCLASYNLGVRADALDAARMLRELGFADKHLDEIVSNIQRLG